MQLFQKRPWAWSLQNVSNVLYCNECCLPKSAWLWAENGKFTYWLTLSLWEIRICKSCMTNSKTVDEDWVVAAQWQTNTATNGRLHTVKLIWCTLVLQLLPFFSTQLVDTSKQIANWKSYIGNGDIQSCLSSDVSIFVFSDTHVAGNPAKKYRFTTVN